MTTREGTKLKSMATREVARENWICTVWARQAGCAAAARQSRWRGFVQAARVPDLTPQTARHTTIVITVRSPDAIATTETAGDSFQS